MHKKRSYTLMCASLPCSFAWHVLYLRASGVVMVLLGSSATRASRTCASLAIRGR
jgi:hypothetical protein